MDYITRTYVINLDKDVLRLASMDKMLRNLNIPYTRFRACDGSSDVVNLSKNLSKNFSKGEYGCTASHLTLYDMLLEEDSDNARYLIFEDDANTYLENNRVLDMITEVYSSGFDPEILYLGKCSERCEKMDKVHEIGLFTGYEPKCTHAYIVNKRGAWKLRSMYAEKTIDHHIVDVKRRLGLDILVFHPSLFYQDVFKYGSNLREIKGKNGVGICNECGWVEDDKGENNGEMGIWLGIVGIISGLLIIFGVMARRDIG